MFFVLCIALRSYMVNLVVILIMYYGALVCMAGGVKGNTFWWQGVYYGGPVHPWYMMGNACFMVRDEGPLS